jgi:hypothetical protein
MFSTLVLAAALVAQPEPGADRGWIQPRKMTPAEQSFVHQPFNARRTKYWRHNTKAKSIFDLRLTHLESVKFMYSHPEWYDRRRRR